MKLPGSIQRMDQAVLVGLNLTKLQQQLDKNLAGYELCVLNYDGTPLFASDEAPRMFIVPLTWNSCRTETISGVYSWIKMWITVSG